VSARSADELVRENYPMIRAEARAFFLPGADDEDVLQEALIAFLNAIRDFNGTGTFTGFARLVIRRHLIQCVRSSQTRYQRALNESVRTLPTDEGERCAADVLVDHRSDVPGLVEQRDTLRLIALSIPKLSPLERSSFVRAMNDEPLLTKSEDNARQRAKKRLRYEFGAAA